MNEKPECEKPEGAEQKLSPREKQKLVEELNYRVKEFALLSGENVSQKTPEKDLRMDWLRKRIKQIMDALYSS